MVKCLNIVKNIGKPIYRSISICVSRASPSKRLKMFALVSSRVQQYRSDIVFD